MKAGNRRFWMVSGLCALFTFALVWLQYEGFTYLQRWELNCQDLRAGKGRLTAENPDLVFVGIDKPGYADDILEQEAAGSPVLQAMRRSYPWPRFVWAALVERLAEAGARVIVIDLVFASENEGDEQFRAALDKYADRVVIGSNFSDSKNREGTKGITVTFPSDSVLDFGTNANAGFDPRVGYVNIWPDWDNVVRRARLRISQKAVDEGVSFETRETGVYESLDARALRLFGRADVIPEEDGMQLFRYTAGAGVGFQPLPLPWIFLPQMWTNNFGAGEFFRNKLVFVGPAANLFQDKHTVPIISAKTGSTEMLGPEIHLNIINAALHGEFLRETTPGQNLIATGAAGLLAVILCFRIRNPIKRLLVILAIAAGYLFVGQILYNRADLATPVFPPVTVLLLCGVAAMGYDFLAERLERARTRKMLERYVSKNIVKELLDNPETFLNVLGGVRRPVAVLFSDVRNFTTMTEGSDEHQLVLQLNEYFTEMVRHVFDNNGTLDKFIGDAVMAVWGNIVTRGPAVDAQDAVATALLMKQSLAELNKGWKQRGWPQLAFGIGINHGEAIVGNLGSVEKMELSVIGDTINLGSRLEGLTKEYHLDLLLGESMASLVRDRFLLRPVDLVQVKGKTKPVEVFAVLGERRLMETEPKWLKHYEAGLDLYRNRRFAEALREFEQSFQLGPDDYINELYIKRCLDYIEHPPGPEWNGVYVMKKK